MPRNWKRTTEKAKWSENDYNSAVADVENGISQRKAATNHGIPYSSFQRKLKKQVKGGPCMGRKPVFTPEQEAEIVDNLKTLANMYYGLTPLQLRQLAFEYAERLKIEHRFNKSSHLAGKDWLEGFLKRNKSISVRKPEATSLNRLKGFNREEVSLFFRNLEKIMVKYRFTPDRMYNMDETGITTVQDTGKIIARKGQKRIGAVTSGEKGKTTTVICCMNAAGSYVPPMFIYARQRMAPTLEVNGPPGSLYACSNNGWTTEGLFVNWLQHFNKYAKPSKEEPVLLILDNHGSHITLEAYTFCRQNNVVVLSLPPHSSHRLQPLDVVFYGPLKTAFHRECDLYLKSRPGERITVYNLAELFNQAYSSVATIAKGVSGFATTGIYPINPNVFSNEDFPFDAPDEHERPQTQPMPTPKRLTTDVSFEDISPIPGTSTAPKTGRPTKQHSIVLTETPQKSLLQEKREKRQQRKTKTGGVKRRLHLRKADKRRKKQEDSSEESDVCLLELCQDSSDGDFMEVSESEEGEKDFMIEKNPDLQKNDFAVVTVSNEKDSKDFVAQVISLEENNITIRFMRSYRGQWDTFVFPDVDDVSVVSRNEVVGKLISAEHLRYGKVRFQ